VLYYAVQTVVDKLQGPQTAPAKVQTEPPGPTRGEEGGHS
jgi:hypothetical protein